MKVLNKLFNYQLKSIDDEDKSVEFVISTDQPDRYGDVVDQKSWDYKNYETNPIVLFGHDPSVPENVLGNANGFKTYLDNSDGFNKTSTRIKFATDINPKAAMLYEMVKRGVLRTVSVGFKNGETDYEGDNPVLKNNELLEISLVPIPANAGAVAKELKAGNYNERDASWLIKGMRDEANLLEKQLKTTNKEKSMTDEQATAALDAIAKLTEQVSNLTKTVEEQNAVIAELKPAEETDEEKTAREAKEAEDAKAAKEAENVAAGLNPDGSAKDGSDDQSGAEGDEFNEDAELTPEQEAELEATFAEATAELELAS